MASLKDLRNRIASVKATRKITKAMQMVAAAKLRRAQAAAESARPYAERMQSVLANLAAATRGTPGAPPLLAGTGSEDRHLLVVCTADRGLCGAFNSSIARFARERINALLAEGKDVKLICVGRKGYDMLRRQSGERIVKHYDFRSLRQIGYAQASEIGHTVLQMFANGEFDVCTLISSRFVAVISQVPMQQQLIPATFPEGEAGVGEGRSYDYEPDEETIIADLLPRNVSVQIFRALLENVAGEWGAKMTAMDNASRNADEMIDRLTLHYNRTRQAQITKELIEIISG